MQHNLHHAIKLNQTIYIFCCLVIPNRWTPTPGDQVQPVVTSPLPRILPHHHLFTRPAAGCHGVRALQDHGAGEGGGRPPAPS